MRKSIAVLLGLASLSSSAFAQESSENSSTFYLSVAGGYAHAPSADVDAGVNVELFFNDGWAGSAAVGTHLTDHIRAELEFALRQVKLDDETIQGLGKINLDGDVDAYSGIVKLAYDFGDGPFRPYVAGGMGLVNYSVDIDQPINGRDDDTVLAFAVEGGLSFRLSERIDVFAAAQFMMLGNVTLDPANTGDADLENPSFVTSSGGLRIHF